VGLGIVSSVTILFVGDVVGKPGRWGVSHLLPKLKAQFKADMTIVNVENSAAGFGCTRKQGQAFLSWGADIMTSGNHIWDRMETQPYLDEEPRLLRPANYPVGNAGVGSQTFINDDGVTFGVLNIQGRVFMAPIDCPFKTADQQIAELRKQTPIIFVDFHAETTSEKQAMGRHLDGRVTAIVGTHTHVQTADDHIMKGGTAYLTDAGMTGPYDSIIGMRPEAAMKRFLTALPERFTVAEFDVRLAAIVVTADAETGMATSIERHLIKVEDDLIPTLHSFKD
jgi:metallophosphoesterase (TIGR00282 family)